MFTVGQAIMADESHSNGISSKEASSEITNRRLHNHKMGPSPKTSTNKSQGTKHDSESKEKTATGNVKSSVMSTKYSRHQLTACRESPPHPSQVKPTDNCNEATGQRPLSSNLQKTSENKENALPKNVKTSRKDGKLLEDASHYFRPVDQNSEANDLSSQSSIPRSWSEIHQTVPSQERPAQSSPDKENTPSKNVKSSCQTPSSSSYQHRNSMSITDPYSEGIALENDIEPSSVKISKTKPHAPDGSMVQGGQLVNTIHALGYGPLVKAKRTQVQKSNCEDKCVKSLDGVSTDGLLPLDEEDAPASIEMLPSELFHMIVGQISVTDLWKLYLTSKKLQTAIERTPNSSKPTIHSDFVEMTRGFVRFEGKGVMGLCSIPVKIFFNICGRVDVKLMELTIKETTICGLSNMLDILDQNTSMLPFEQMVVNVMMYNISYLNMPLLETVLQNVRYLHVDCSDATVSHQLEAMLCRLKQLKTVKLDYRVRTQSVTEIVQTIVTGNWQNLRKFECLCDEELKIIEVLQGVTKISENDETAEYCYRDVDGKVYRIIYNAGSRKLTIIH